jgi:triosephosphate isomerase
MRKPLLAANWKMYKTVDEARSFVAAFLPMVKDHTRDEIVICPAMPLLAVVAEACRGSNVHVGAQNMNAAEEGAYTGESSCAMIKSLGCTHVIIGHSERRQHYHETDEMVNAKLKAALKAELTPIVCVGELDAEREAGHTAEVLRRQTSKAIAEISPEHARALVIAYEPVWAIGTGKTATPELAAEAHLTIRTTLAHTLGREFADGVRILYGGSVKPENVSTLLNQPEIDGALVGGASLDPVSFAKIVNYTGF